MRVNRFFREAAGTSFTDSAKEDADLLCFSNWKISLMYSINSTLRRAPLRTIKYRLSIPVSSSETMPSEFYIEADPGILWPADIPSAEKHRYAVPTSKTKLFTSLLHAPPDTIKFCDSDELNQIILKAFGLNIDYKSSDTSSTLQADLRLREAKPVNKLYQHESWEAFFNLTIGEFQEQAELLLPAPDIWVELNMPPRLIEGAGSCYQEFR